MIINQWQCRMLVKIFSEKLFSCLININYLSFLNASFRIGWERLSAFLLSGSIVLLYANFRIWWKRLLACLVSGSIILLNANFWIEWEILSACLVSSSIVFLNANFLIRWERLMVCLVSGSIILLNASFQIGWKRLLAFLSFFISNRNWFAWWFPLVNERVICHFHWGCRAWLFPCIDGRFIVNEGTFATTIFCCWRWHTRECIQIRLLFSDRQRPPIRCFFRLGWTHDH